MEHDKHLPAALLEHECDNCGYVYLDDCVPEVVPVKPVEWAQGIVVTVAGCSASSILYRVVEICFWALQHGQASAIDLNVIVLACCTALGSIMGWAFAKGKITNE